MRNEALEKLEPLIGEWNLTLTNAWFLEDPEARNPGTASFEWLADAFIVMRWLVGDDPAQASHLVFGRSDAQERYIALSHDERGVSRVFDMTFADGQWTLDRQDPDFHQRFIATVKHDRIDGRWEASEDAGTTWRKDFDLIFERKRSS